MKNCSISKTITTAFFAFLAINIFAQDISIGVKGGVNFANIGTFDLIENAEFLPEFRTLETANFGLVSEIEVHPNFAIQPELVYTTKGFKMVEGTNINLFSVPVPIGVTAISKFNYLELPLLAKAKFGTGKVQTYLVAGPTFGYALNGKIETRANVIVELDLYETPINLDNLGYERWEIGGMVGAGLAFDTGGGQLFVDGRYSHGFTQVYDIPVVRDKVQNKGFGINAGYMIRF